MRKQRDPAAGENEVGFAGQIGQVRPEPEPHRMDSLAGAHLRASVLPLDPGHDQGAPFRRCLISQRRLSLDREPEAPGRRPPSFRCGERRSQAVQIVGFQDRHKPASNPFRDRRRHGVADRMIA